MPFDFVEERQYSANDFRLATACIWIARNPASAWHIDESGLALLEDGKEIAVLDLRENWDGLLKIYFGRGRVPEGKPLFIKIPLVEGGLWKVGGGKGYRLLAFGGRTPPYYLLGPMVFRQ